MVLEVRTVISLKQNKTKKKVISSGDKREQGSRERLAVSGVYLDLAAITPV